MNYPLTTLVAVPALVALVVLWIRTVRVQLFGLLTVAFLHLCLTLVLGLSIPSEELASLLRLDSLGYLFLLVTSVLFAAVSLYSVSYLTSRTHDTPAALHRFVPCLLGFLSMMSLVIVSHHLALMWAAVEATTLTSAPLIYFYRRKQALEATWKYLMICSVGIALALLGTFCLGIASSSAAADGSGLLLSTLQQHAPHLAKPWLRVAFILALVGYGTKMGLAPLHSWLPDAHSQAPSPVSALLSGALLNCAFLGILRFYQVCVSAGEARFAQDLLIAMGALSLVVATAFILGQHDYKRLFAYSSVENMGILALGIGIGGRGTYGSMLHAVMHSFAKAGLFLVAGNVLNLYGTTNAHDVRGMLQRYPVTATLLLVGLFAIGGFPPFGLFVSEFRIFQAAMNVNVWIGVLFLSLLAVAFLGMAAVVLPMVQDKAPAGTAPPRPVYALSTIAPLFLLSVVLVLGVHVPVALSDLLQTVAESLGGTR
jgi:hydrogenase-4 component F